MENVRGECNRSHDGKGTEEVFAPTVLAAPNVSPAKTSAVPLAFQAVNASPQGFRRPKRNTAPARIDSIKGAAERGPQWPARSWPGRRTATSYSSKNRHRQTDVLRGGEPGRLAPRIIPVEAVAKTAETQENQ